MTATNTQETVTPPNINNQKVQGQVDRRKPPKKAGMGVVAMIGKVVLIITNVILLLSSTIMVIAGLIVVSGTDIYKNMADEFDSELKTALANMGTNVDTSNLSISEFVVPLAYAVIVIGVVIGSMSLLGCIGACCSVKIVLFVYVVVTSVMLLVQVIVTILIYAEKSTFDSTVKPYIKDTLNNYHGIEGTDARSLSWNALMNFEKCCGVDDYRDFHKITGWPAPIKGVMKDLKTPAICCKTKTIDLDCAINPTDANNYWKTGCYEKLYDLLASDPLIVTVIVIVIQAQFVLIFFAIWILCTKGNKIDII